MQIKVTANERAHVYAFLGGLSMVPFVARDNRRKLSKVADKFGPGATDTVSINQAHLQFLLTMLDMAIVNGEKALLNPATTDDQKQKIQEVNKVFGGMVERLLPQSKDGILDSGASLLGIPVPPPMKAEEKAND